MDIIEKRKNHAEYMREYYKKNPEKRIAWKKWFKEYRKTNKEYNNKFRKIDIKKLESRRREREIFVINAKMVPCKDCGIRFPPWIMQFDHRNPKDKKGNIGHMLANAKSLDDIRKEIEKCDVVCSNCHDERTHQRYLDNKRSKFDLRTNLWKKHFSEYKCDNYLKVVTGY